MLNFVTIAQFWCYHDVELKDIDGDENADLDLRVIISVTRN